MTDAMPPDEINRPATAASVLPSLPKLAVFAVILPVLVATTTQMLVRNVRAFPSLQSWLYPYLIFTTAILSWCAGRYLQPAWLRWILLAWCLALLDALTMIACLEGSLEDQFGYVLVSAQLSLLVLWAVLGTGYWQWRLPAVAALSPLVIMFSGSFMGSYYSRAEQSWNLMLIIATPIIALLCGGLRFFGFSLRDVRLEDGDAAKPGKRPTYQFGTKHMLIWLTVAGPLLLLVRGLDFGGRAIFPAALLAASIATVNLIAIWAVLGAGYWVIRIVSLVGVPFLIAQGMSSYSAYLKSTATKPWYSLYGTIAFTIGEMEDLWIAWLWLDAALLAALLLFLRASGYRLMRSRPPLAST